MAFWEWMVFDARKRMSTVNGGVMKIQDEQHFLGAALMQISEDDRFSSINPLIVGGKKIANGFLINDNTALFLRYRRKGEERNYRFKFTAEHLDDIVQAPIKKLERVVLGLVCVEDREICCVDLAQLTGMMHFRDGPVIDEDAAYTITVIADENCSFRVAGKEPGGKFTHAEVVIARNRFPTCVLYDV